MDALSLVLPAAAIANPGSNGADSSAPGTGSDAAPVDFAALLAAGLMPQQDMAGVLPVPPAAPQTADQTAEHEGNEISMDAAARSLAGLQGALHTSVIGHASSTFKDDQPSAVPPDAADLKAAMTTANGKAAADIAAEAATIAGAAAQTELAVLGDTDARAQDQSGAADAAHGASSESSTSLGHLLHLGATEKLSTTRPNAMLEVGAPVDGPDFAQALSQQVVWMADKDAQIAELRINPPELGPVEVRLQISGDEAVVQFASAHADVRSAIEAALARLRESMAQAGIQLGDASVSAESFREQDAHHSGTGEGRSGYRHDAERGEPAWVPTPIATGVRRGLVDLFA
jgi:flagellar hook-length control protein FliK